MADGTGRAGSSTERRTRRSSLPIAAYLVILALVAIVPAFMYSAYLLEQNNQAQQNNVETLITSNARGIVQAVDGQILANITTLKLLATSAELQLGEYAQFHDRVGRALAGTGSFVFIADSGLNNIVTTRLPTFSTERSPISDKETALRARESGNVAISDVVYGSVSKQWVVNIMLPVTGPGDEPMVMGFNRDASRLSVALLTNKMPEGWHVTLLDGKNRVIADSENKLEVGHDFGFESLPDFSSSNWQQLERDGKDYLFVTQNSGLSGWKVVAYAEEDIVTQPLATAYWSLIAGGILLASVVVLVVMWLSTRIGRSVQGLAADARRLGLGQPLEPRPFPIAEVDDVSKALGDASRRRQQAETEVRFLMRELAHRSKNQMTVIAAMAKQTARGATRVSDFVADFEKRIFGLARSTDLLLAHGVAGVDLRELLVGQIDPFAHIDGKRVIVRGPQLRLNAQAGQIVGMAAHELATNAMKYGALAADNGTLEVSWSRGSDTVTMIWQESGFVPNIEPGRRGFGTTVLESMVGRSLRADVERTVTEDGLKWTLVIPMSTLDPTESLNGPMPEGSGHGDGDAPQK